MTIGPSPRSRAASWTQPSRQRRRWRAPDWAGATREALKRRYWLRLHLLIIAALTLGFAWVIAWGWRQAGVDALALRYALTLPLAYGAYLLLLRLWAGSLVRGNSPLEVDPCDLVPDPSDHIQSCAPEVSARGASGGLDASLETAGDAAGSLLEGAAALDEGIVVAVPLAVLAFIVALLGALLGAGVFMLFGIEVLLSVAVEVALASMAGSLAYKGWSEGWLDAALRHTWKGAAGSWALGIALGFAIDRWLPQADSLGQALKLLG